MTQSDSFKWYWRRPTLDLWLGICGCFKVRLEAKHPGGFLRRYWLLTIEVLDGHKWRPLSFPRGFRSNLVAREVADFVVDAWLDGGLHVEDERGTTHAREGDFERAWDLFAQEVEDSKEAS
jgi:hypothetical protein